LDAELYIPLDLLSDDECLKSGGVMGLAARSVGWIVGLLPSFVEVPM
jgi:hypothetical protein